VSLNDFAMGMPLRVALNNNIQGTWLSGDKVFVYLEGKSGINSDVLTYVTDDSGGFRWSPVNCDPMLYINSTYVFFTSNHSIFLYFGINWAFQPTFVQFIHAFIAVLCDKQVMPTAPGACDPMLHINSTYVFFTSNHSIFLYFGINWALNQPLSSSHMPLPLLR